VGYFGEIEHIGGGNGMRVMGLRDGNKKMSKSDVSEMSRLNMKDSPEELFNKVMKAKTDSIGTVKYDR
jgi:tryptophanyl-tRNA synthetase